MGRILQFEELALRIQPGGEGGLIVQVTQSPYGSQASCRADLSAWIRETSLIRATEATLRGSGPTSRAVRNLADEPNGSPVLSPQAVGEGLFRALFSGPVLETFLLSLGRVETQPDTGLRIRLALDPSLPDLPEIGALPWELLYRPDTRDFLARNPLTPLVRYLEVPRLTAPAPLAASLRILVVRSRPYDQSSLDLDRERDVLVDAWGDGSRVEIDVLDQPTLGALRRKLMGEPYHVLHFMGHGDFDAETGEGVLVFEDASRQSVPVSSRTLAEALKGSRWLRLVFLNACDTAQLPRRRGQDPFSGVASALVLAGIPAVVAMQYPISDEAALVFSQHFYSAVAAGYPVDAAAAEARLGIHLSFPSSWEWATPALFMSVPDGRILAQESARPRGEPQSAVPPAPSGAAAQFIFGNSNQFSGYTNFGGHQVINITTLGELDQMAPEKKRELLATYERQVRDFPEMAQVHFALGLSYLDLRLYDQALASLKQALGKGSKEAGLYFYIALAALGGKQPRSLSLARIREIESYLEASLRTDRDNPEALLLWAIIKHDYYRANGLRVAPPSIEELLQAVTTCRSPNREAEILSRHLTVPQALLKAIPY
jgi:hypothetical protein